MIKLEDMMFKDGWKQSRRLNAGKLYITWHKDGFEIDNDDIILAENELNSQKGISQDVKTSEGSLAGQGATHQAHNLEKRQQPSSSDTNDSIKKELDKDYG